jgi:hypothetical protein
VPFVLRRITRARWYKKAAAPFLAKADVPADPFGDLRTASNKLSVWWVDEDKSNLRRIAAAVAATRHKPDKFDYLLFDSGILGSVDITVEQTHGKTQDHQVNRCHRDLVELSGRKLFELVRAIMTSDHETGRFPERDIKTWVEEAVGSGRLDFEKLPKSFQEKMVR